jgi:PDZ domain-containing protein
VDTEVDVAPEVEPARVRLRWRPVWFVLGAVLLLVITLVGAAGLVPAPYVVYAPGSAIDTAPAITTPGTKAYDDTSTILFLTASLRGASRRASFIESWWGWLRPDQDVFPRKAILGDQTGRENREAALQAMTASQEVAAKVALEHLGYEVPEEGTGAIVSGVVEGAPVSEAVAPGDVIVAVDGEPIEVDTQLRGALDGKAPGDVVVLTVERHGEEGETEDVEVELIEDPDEPERALLGVSVVTRDLSYDLPFPVRVDTEDVGGPSAGLALTLGILDHLTPGPLAGDTAVAVTGTIAPDGTVGEVGGIPQKGVAAERAGAELLLVPKAEEEAARRSVGSGVEVVGVTDLDDALEALAEVGGNALDLDTTGDG